MQAHRRGFTLIEVLIVIVIILALMGFLAFNVLSARDTSQIDLVKIDLKGFQNKLKEFNLAFNRYPTEEEGLGVLWNKELLDPEADQARWRAFMDSKPRDPWGQPWGFRAESDNEGRPFDLWSNGPDKEEGTDDDISLWTIDGDADEDDLGFGSDIPASTGG